MTEMTGTVLPQRTPELVAAEIRSLTAGMLGSCIEIGRRMCEAKEMLPHGAFSEWVEQNTGYSRSSASNFMRLYTEYGAAQGSLFGVEANGQTVGRLTYTKALALLALPAEERESFAEEHNAAELSTRELKRLIRERDEALAARQEAENVARGREMIEAELRAQLEAAVKAQQDAEQTSDALLEQLEALEARPVEVAVETVHAAPEELAAARKEGEAAAMAAAEKAAKAADEAQKAAKAQAEKEKAALQKQLEEAEASRVSAAREAAELRKQLEAAGKRDKIGERPELVEFSLHFQDAQAQMERMAAVLQRLADAGEAELAAKLRRALAALSQMAAKMAEVTA